MIHAVILAGGSGTRLWPLSRQHFPKQLQNFVDNYSLLQNTVQRLSGLAIAKTTVICHAEHRFIIAEQLKNINCHAEIILEPEAKNTAAAITIAALSVSADQLLLLLPADHFIGDIKTFHQAIDKALTQAKMGYLAAFGIKATSANSDYGYIKSGQTLSKDVYLIERFIEKPNKETATRYLDENQRQGQDCYTWNSGMFVCQASVLLSAIQKHQPILFEQAEQAWLKAKKDFDFLRLDAVHFKQINSISFDHAVMEKTNNGVVVLLDANWDDLGSFTSFFKFAGKVDENNNVLIGDVVSLKTTNSDIKSDGRLLTSIGVDNLIVIDTADTLLIADKSHLSSIKQLIIQLKSTHPEHLLAHNKVFRPWGSYQVIADEINYKIKRIIVTSGAKLSLQRHQKRAEHWVVLKGIATITKGDKCFDLNVNESVFIPSKTVHSLMNKQKTELEIIEIQTGQYFGEDDIERLEDNYGRT